MGLERVERREAKDVAAVRAPLPEVKERAGSKEGERGSREAMEGGECPGLSLALVVVLAP